MPVADVSVTVLTPASCLSGTEKDSSISRFVKKVGRGRKQMGTCITQSKQRIGVRFVVITPHDLGRGAIQIPSSDRMPDPFFLLKERNMVLAVRAVSIGSIGVSTLVNEKLGCVDVLPVSGKAV